MTRKKYNVIIAERADKMLLAHTQFLAKVSIPATRKLVADFKTIMNNLKKNPLQYVYADDFDVPKIPLRTYRKCIFYGRYKVLFLIEGNTVYIDAIIDCRQENSNLFTSKNR